MELFTVNQTGHFNNTDKEYNVSDAGGPLWVPPAPVLWKENRWKLHGLSADVLRQGILWKSV